MVHLDEVVRHGLPVGDRPGQDGLALPVVDPSDHADPADGAERAQWGARRDDADGAHDDGAVGPLGDEQLGAVERGLGVGDHAIGPP